MAAEKTTFSVFGLFECSSQGKSNDGRHFQRDVEKTRVQVVARLW